ncbi:UDP-glucose/GDP-mannose dehydrogenase family, NAD binding domain-containing protein [Mycena sanguinolenta]|nr:UDP-glucose/GDP-mannose dehydrogenase family, NAD binding domain-containing protein [Mycena sanguinolenta]
MAPVKFTKVLCTKSHPLQNPSLGAGYVGGPTCAVITLKCPHITVTIVDLNKARINAWNSPDFKLPIYEIDLEDVIRACRGHNLFFSTDVEKGIREAELIFVSVNTPTKKSGVGAGFAADLNYVELATCQVAVVATTSKIVVEKSTFPCRTAESMCTIQVNSKPGCHFDILSNPEFFPEGTAISDLFKPDRLSKLAANAMLTQRISSVNALSICEVTVANINEVVNAVGYDSRVGHKFLKASIGFSGRCFQKDILNLVYLSKSLYLPEVAMNKYQKLCFSKHVVDTLFNTVTGKRIVVFGFAFTAGTGDTRESAAITFIRDFQSERAFVNFYDPQANVKKQVKICKSAFEARRDAEAVVIATKWKEHRSHEVGCEWAYPSINRPP